MFNRPKKATWRDLITEAMKARGDSWSEVEGSTISEAELDVKFDDGFGGSEGIPFTVWTKKYVYFPAVYDGAEWAASVPRNPCDDKTKHVGGE